MNKLLEQLNEEQLKPVEDTEGAVLVLAGAGSGKTRVLTTRIAYLIEEKGVSPYHILAITFTNKAAKEMQERISALTDSAGMWISTIHSMCVKILRKNAESIGFNDRFSIYSESERSSVLKQSFKECDYEDEKLLKTCKWHVGNAKMLGLQPREYTLHRAMEGDSDNAEVIEKVYARYQAHLRENNAMDFDDLLMLTHRLLREKEEVRAYYAGKFQYILVDEFQDTNSVQFEIIRMLASVHNNLFAVGDDDQSIYGWRGAEIKNILSFEKSFPGAKVYKLEQNYRSTKTILNLANTVIRHNVNRKDKTLWTNNQEGGAPVVYEGEEETDEALFTAATISKFIQKGAKFSDFAVLMRINALTRAYEQEFTKYGIPYKVFGGFKFFERKEIKDLLAYLRIVNNPFDSEAVVRIINFPKRGIGDKTVQTLQDYAAKEELSVYDALLFPDDVEGLTTGAKAKLSAFAKLIKDLVIRGQELPLDELVRYLIEQTGMREAYADNSDESITKRANIDEFQNSVDEFVRLNPEATLDDYLNQVALSSDVDEMDEENYVTLATVHAVKGLEFPCVFVCGLEEGRFPVSSAADDPDEMEEERRLMYVAITRAGEKIYFTRSKSRYLYGKREPTARSCFLKELGSLIDLPEERIPFKRFSGDFDEDEGYGYARSARSNYGGYGGGRYGNSSYGNSSYGNSSYGNSSYGNRSSYGYGNSGVKRTAYRDDSSLYKSYGGGSGHGGNGYGNSGNGYGNRENKPSQTVNSFSLAKKMTGSGAAAPRGAGGDKSALLQAGTRVSHPKFGQGTVLSYRGAPDNAIIKVDFGSFGVKELSARLAPLTIV